MTADDRDDPMKQREPLTLIVGDAAAWLSAGRSLPDDPGLHYVTYEELTDRLISELDPDIILAPLLGQGFDALDLAVQLEDFGFRGRFRALCPRLPNPALVHREIQALCPSIDFDLFVIEDPGRRRLN